MALGGSDELEDLVERETELADTIAYSVRTDGWILPVSICETRLGETSRRRASSRRLMPLAKRRSRSCAPTSGVGVLGLAGPAVAEARWALT